MSIATLTNLAVSRDSGAPTRADVGKAPSGSGDATASPSIGQLLVTMVPTGVIAPYTAVVAALVGYTKSTDDGDDLLLGYRWTALAIMAILAFGLTYFDYKRKAAAASRFPLAEASGAALVSIAWALSTPESPLQASLDGAAAVALPVVVAFAGVAIGSLIAASLRSPA